MCEKLLGTKKNIPNATQRRGMYTAMRKEAARRREDAQEAFRHHQENCQGKGRRTIVVVRNNGSAYTNK